MMASRDVGDISTHPGGRSGADWTEGTRDSLLALWALNGGLLVGIDGANAITAAVAVADGFTAYSDGLRCTFIADQSNTGPATINISSVGSKAVLNPDGDALIAGSIVAGRTTEIVFSAADDAFRLVTAGGTTNVTVQGGIMVQQAAPSRLVTAAGPATAATTIGSQSFQCIYAESRVLIDGNVGRVTGAGSADDDGTVIALYVDTVSVQSFTDYCQPNALVNTPFCFSYNPGDTDTHTYEIRVSSTIAATYPKGSNVIRCSEVSQNP
jgi:hypothetical protein